MAWPSLRRTEESAASQEKSEDRQLSASSAPAVGRQQLQQSLLSEGERRGAKAAEESQGAARALAAGAEGHQNKLKPKTRRQCGCPNCSQVGAPNRCQQCGGIAIFLVVLAVVWSHSTSPRCWDPQVTVVNAYDQVQPVFVAFNGSSSAITNAVRGIDYALSGIRNASTTASQDCRTPLTNATTGLRDCKRKLQDYVTALASGDEDVARRKMRDAQTQCQAMERAVGGPTFLQATMLNHQTCETSQTIVEQIRALRNSIFLPSSSVFQQMSPAAVTTAEEQIDSLDRLLDDQLDCEGEAFSLWVSYCKNSLRTCKYALQQWNSSLTYDPPGAPTKRQSALEDCGLLGVYCK